MGVNLTKIINRKEIKLEDLSNKTVGVDAFNTLYQFLSSIRGYDGEPLKNTSGKITSHLQGLFSRSLNLMSKNIKLVYVFDGKPPALKYGENKERSLRKSEAEDKYQEAKDEENIDLMYKYSKQFVRLDKTMIEESKQLAKALGLPIIQAESEAEGQIAYMNKKNDIDFAASQDYDALLFGANQLIRNLTLSQKRKLPGGKVVYTFLESIDLKKVLEELQLTQEQLIVLGILTGTDFDPGGIKGIGPKKALKLVKENSDYDKMFKELKAEFNWKEIYNIFHNLPVNKDYKLKWELINEEKVREILVEENDFSLERVNSSLQKYNEENKLKNQKGLGEFL